MRSLSASLLAAQKSPSGQPYVKVEVVERVAGVARLAWSRLYSSSEADFFHAATMPGDGSLVRARVGSSSPYWVYIQRVASPGPGSDFSQWASLAQTSGAAGVALASQAAEVLLFFVDTDGCTIKCSQSTNYGQSFGTPATILTAAGNVGWLAADFSAAGVVALFYSVSGTVYVVKRNGTWGSPSAWTNSLSGITGLACAYDGDWNLAISGGDATSSYRVWACLYGDGYSQPAGTWSGLMELTMASPGSSTEFRCPSLAYPDVFRILFVEKYTGSEAYSRVHWSHSLLTAEFVSNLWREPVPFNLASSYGLAITYSGSFAWLSAPFGVWRAGLLPASVDISADVLALEMAAEPFSGQLRLELRNDDGRYNSPGSGAYASIKSGSEVRVSPGYRTPAGAEVSSGPAFWIESWEHSTGGGQARLVAAGRRWLGPPGEVACPPAVLLAGRG